MKMDWIISGSLSIWTLNLREQLELISEKEMRMIYGFILLMVDHALSLIMIFSRLINLVIK
jgi:hypothetical protein